jgi:PAS domain S-box-containing protein
MPWLLPSVIAALAGSFVLTSVYFYLYSQDRQKFLLVWAAGWTVYLLRFCFMLVMLLSGNTASLSAAYHLSALVSGVLLLWGTHLFINRPLPRVWIAGAAAIGVWTAAAIALNVPFLVSVLPNFFFLGAVYILTGSVLLRAQMGAGGRIVGWAFILWGVHKADYPFLRQAVWFAPWGYLLSSVIELTVAIGMLLVYFQKMKMELVEKEKRFRLFAENARDIIFRYRLAPERGFEYVSPSVTVLTGYTPEEHYVDPDLGFKLVHPQDRELLKQSMKAPDSLRPLVIRWVHKNGAVLWTEQRNVPLYDNTGRLAAIEGIARDITERKRAEETLQQHERRFREFLEKIHLSAVMLDREGKVIFCNDHLLNLTGWSRDEVIGRNWFDLFIPEDLRAGVSKFFAALVAGQDVPFHNENPILTRKGEQRLLVWDNTFLLDSGGAIVGAASIGIDITEQRKLEDQLRQAQKMEAVGQLAGGIAHDFNNILTAIIGYAYLLKMSMEKDNPQLMKVESVLEAAQKAAALTHSLLAFSRKQAISIKPVDLNAVIRNGEKLLLRVIGEDIEVRTILANGPLAALADAGQVEQVLMNLATNARDAMPKGGCLTIRSERSTIDGAFIEAHGFGEPGAYALITVSDTGTGMDERTREKIFEPFFTTKETGKGTGLGLSMVYGMVKQHDGFIDVRSEPGKGATFYIYLPLAMQAGEESDRVVEKQDEPTPRGSGTILLAEDDETLRELASSVLRESGYAVIEAADGEEAVRKFVARKEEIGLVILDVIMPKKSGKQAYDEIRAMRPAVRALFVSGYAPDIVREKGLLEGGAEILLKPFLPSELLRKADAVLREGRST